MSKKTTKRGKKNRGFTLIELMIVIAIIAIIAAIAIPNILGATVGSNEQSAVASLGSLCSAEEKFKKEDPDLNRIPDFWTFDVTGLSVVRPGAAGTQPCKLIDTKLANADSLPRNAAPPAGVNVDVNIIDTVYSPNNGYWFRQLTQRQDAAGVAQNIDADGNGRDQSNYAMIAYPHQYGKTGKFAFIVDNEKTVYRRDCGSETAVLGVVVPEATPHGNLAAGFNVYPHNKTGANFFQVK